MRISDWSSDVCSSDLRNGPIEDWNGGYSGYYLRKFIDPNIEHEYAAAGGNQEAPWHYFRLGEIYLNYAEACLGLGEEDEAKTYINMIRERAGDRKSTRLNSSH